MVLEELESYFREFVRKQQTPFFVGICTILASLHSETIREMTGLEAFYQVHSDWVDLGFILSFCVAVTGVLSSIRDSFKDWRALFIKRRAEEKALQEQSRLFAEARAKIAQQLSCLPIAEANLLRVFIDSKTDFLFLSGDDLAARGLVMKGLLFKGERKEAQTFVFEAPEYAFSLNPEHAEFIRAEWAKINAARFNKHNRKKKK